MTISPSTTSPDEPTKRGTGADFSAFLNWAETKGEIPIATTKNWRNATGVVFEVEGDWSDLDLINLDVEALLDRFTTLRRTKYTEGSLQAYKSRVRASIEAYRKWLDNAPDWKPATVRSGSSQKPAKKAAKSTPKYTIVDPTKEEDVADPTPSARQLPPAAGMITYPFPVRPGVQCQLVLPEDLTEKEAARVGAFVKSLAFTEPLALTTGRSVDDTA